jgi:Caspase domain
MTLLHHCRVLWLVLCVSCAVAQTAAAAGKLALVIGNGAYANATELPNPPNDAGDMDVVLRTMGFDVITAINATKIDMDAKIREFAERAETADVTLFFYAGHGMQVNGVNYLIPVDAKLESSTSLDFETVNAENVIRYMSSDTRVGLVFLDACRDNPLSRRFKTKSRSAAVSSGLATRTGSDPNLLIAFATAPGEVALDGAGRNSPFTSSLIKYLPQPNKELRSVLTDVKAEVQHITDKQQIPWSHDNLVTNLYLLGEPGAAPKPEQVVEPPVAKIETVTPPPPTDEAKLAWDAVKDQTSPAVLETVAHKYPNSIYGELAKARAAELRAQTKKHVASIAPEPPPIVEQAPQKSRGLLRWGVIIGSYPKSQVSKARARMKAARAQGLDAVLINTDDYSNLSEGLFAVVIGAPSRGSALQLAPEVQQYFGDAYAKQLQ